MYPGAYCTGGQHCCGPLNDEMPFGALQTTAHGVLEGWACDPDAEGDCLSVLMFLIDVKFVFVIDIKFVFIVIYS